ncbi:chondroitin AC/alginate lyase [Cytidiella melzeri]|nr:chondroitin AC/alginate lyase [Cytidiella melzeri]
MSCATSTLLFLATILPAVHSFVNYANDFLNPDYVLAKNYSQTTIPAQNTIRQWAESSSAGGPWSVTTKPYLAPSGDRHDYMSWAPYSWPNCTGVGNTTELTPQQIWTTCPYITRDGLFNPDARTVNNIGDFDSMANAVLLNSLAWAIEGDSVYSSRVATYVQAWFLDADTYMNPNLNYAQMARGPQGQTGAHTGILDLKSMTKLTSGVLILREGKAVEWTTYIDTQFNNWLNLYIEWLETATIALQEKNAANNHGSFYYNQLASLQLLVNDNISAQSTIEEYFSGIYMGQIAANGDQVRVMLVRPREHPSFKSQPLESARTRPYHYRAYNLAAMITNARIGEYLGIFAWNKTTTAGATIQAAADYAMTVAPGSEDPTELYPDIAAVAATYGDPVNKYRDFLVKANGSAYVVDASFFWNQPFSDNGFAAALNPNAMSTSAESWSGGGENRKGLRSWRALGMLYGACGIVMAVSFVEFL